MSDRKGAPQGTHFWFMTVQVDHAGAGTGNRIYTYSGLCTPGRGSTPLDMFTDLVAGVVDKVAQGDPSVTAANVAVIAHDIRPNKF